MAPRSDPFLEQQILTTFDALASGTNGRVLVLGKASKSLETELRNRSDHLTLTPDMASVSDEAGFDAAVVVGRLEYERWDRWELQQLHGLLRPEAALVVAVPNLASFWSLSGLWFIAGRIVREVRIRLARKSVLPMAETGLFGGRRYRASGLHVMLDGLGYEIKSRATAGNALYRLAAGLSPKIARDTCNDHIMGARRMPSLWTDDGRRPFPDADTHMRDFESAHAPNTGVRDRWASAHPHLAGPPATPFDPAAYAGAKVLVLAPHPDDEIIGCGGTLRRLIDAGAHVTLLHATDGSDSAAFTETPEAIRTTVRVEEAARVAAGLTAQETVYWKADNRNFRMTDDLVETLAKLLARLSPRIVFIPFVTDIHPDHFTLSRMLAAALPKSGLDLSTIEVFNYEVWSLVPANVVCDVTDLMPLVERLLLMYDTALKVDDYVHLCASRMFYNACRYSGRKGYADAFVALPASRYIEVLQEQEREPIQPQ